MEIIVMKNDIAAQDGKGVLLLSSKDYELYADKMKKVLDAETLPEEIKEAQKYIRQCESDMGFMGSPTYEGKKRLVENYFAPIANAKKEAEEKAEYERLKSKFNGA